MKHITTYILAMGIGLAGLTSCSDSWLETNSTQATEGNTLFATTSNARLAINGLCRTMLYGEYPGETFFFPYMAPGWSPLMNGESTITQSNSSVYDSYPWYYYYMLVSGANAVIGRIDAAEGTQEEKDFLKAEALTFRAYSFMRLVEIYCDPWHLSNNGANSGIVLRLKEVVNAGEETDMPLSTMAQTYEQIYKDLDEAIRLYQSSGLSRNEVYSDASSTVSYPDETVAHSIYARAALNKQDYDKALSEAKLALGDSYILMDNGFGEYIMILQKLFGILGGSCSWLAMVIMHSRV